MGVQKPLEVSRSHVSALEWKYFATTAIRAHRKVKAKTLDEI
jgi:hypothetical protein